MNQIILFFFLILSNPTLGQIKGVCIDQKGEVISYVNISVKGEKVGTVSNEKGQFLLLTNRILSTDTLKFSHIGFKPLNIIASEVKGNIVLKENYDQLEEVLITKKKSFKRREIGTLRKRNMITLYSFSKGLGNEIGKLINVKKGIEYELLECKIKIANIDFKQVTIRVNFYKIKSNNQVDKSPYNNEDIIVKINKEGDVSIPLSEYNLILDSDFLVSIEWIDFKEKKKKSSLIEYASNVYSGPFFYRQNKNVEWEKQSLKYNTGLGISLVTNKYKK